MALAVATVFGLAGCVPATSAAADPGGHRFLTIAQAKAAYAAVIRASDTAAARGDKKRGLSIVAAAQWSVVKAEYTARSTTGTPVPRYRYGTPVFYVPELRSYPQWFMVAVPRTPRAGGPAVSVIMLFEREEAGKPWTMNGAPVLGQRLPAIARGPDGYAIKVSTDDSALVLRPDVAGATQAAVVDDGPANPAAAVVGTGPATTGFYAAQAAQARADAARGLQYQWLLQGAPYPVFALRTADGGALVLYGMSLNVAAMHPNLAAGSPIPVPAGVAPQFTLRHEVGYHGLWVDWTYEYAAFDPPPARNAKLQVIGTEVAATYAHAVLSGVAAARRPMPGAGSWRRPGCGQRAAPPTTW